MATAPQSPRDRGSRGGPGERQGGSELLLANERLQLKVRPDLGGRIDQLVDRQTGKAWLYHPEGYAGATRSLPVGASFDDNWTGGWDEVFPNDAPGSFEGYELVDHGELWSQAWEVLEWTDRRLRMRLACRTVPAVVEKSLLLDERAPEVAVRYRLEHLGSRPLPYLFKLHAAVAVEPGDRLLLPRCEIEPVTLDFSTIIGRAEKTPWPTARGASGEEIRVDRVPPREANAQEFVYASGLETGWCGVANPRSGTSLLFRFDLRHQPYVWLFQSFGRWRGHYVVVVEPATTMPYDLEAARRQGTCAVLPANGVTEFAVIAALTDRAD